MDRTFFPSEAEVGDSIAAAAVLVKFHPLKPKWREAVAAYVHDCKNY